MIEHIKELIEKFLSGEYDALAFSYDLPDYIVDKYEDICREDERLAKDMDDTFPEICAEFERGMDSESFKLKIRIAYEKLFKKNN